MERIFGTDGIRASVGVWPLVPDFVLRIGWAFGTILRKQSKAASIVVGRDTRESGPALQSALVSGFLASGVDVTDVGVISTPGVAVLTRGLKATAGAVLSASHNPVDQNGLKFFDEAGKKLSEGIELEIESLAATPNISWGAMPGRLVEGHQLHELYVRELLSEHPHAFLDGIKLVMDCGNGASYRTAPEVFSRAGANVLAINTAPTGTNINVLSGSEHVRRSPAEMTALVQESKADFGIAFDGDADRVIFLDEKGGIVDGDHMLGLFARYLHKEKRLLANTVVTTNMRNTGLKNFIEADGIKLEETPVGDKYVIERLIELRAKFSERGLLGVGGEQAGHVALLDESHLTGDGVRTGLFFIRAFREAGGGSMARFAAGVGKTPQIIASAHVGDLPRIAKDQLAEMETAALRQTPGLIRISLRYSGTEPLFRVMLESDGKQSEDDLARIAMKLCAGVQSERERKEKTVDVLSCGCGSSQLP